MCRDAAVSGITRGFDRAPPKWSGNWRHGTSAMLRMKACRCSAAMSVVSFPVLSLLLRRRAARNPARPEGRLLVRRRRQLPGAGRRRPDLRIDMHVEEERLAGFDGVLERAFEILGLGHGHRIDAGGARPGGEIGIVGLVIVALGEHGAELAAA